MRKIIIKRCVVILLLTMLLFFAAGCGSSTDNQDVTEAQMTTEGQPLDFSGVWTGTHMVAEVRGEDAENYKDIEGVTLDSRLNLSLSDNGTGTAELYFVDDLAGPALNASVAQESLILSGTLWGDPFEWNGTFEYDETESQWTLTGGGDITDTAEGVVFHIVLSLNQDADDMTIDQLPAEGEVDPGSELFGPPIEGERYETETVSMIIPDGWNVFDIAGGLQAYRGNNAVEVWVRGSGLSDSDAEKAMEGFVNNYDGTPVEAFEHWGLSFYSTAFEMNGTYQLKMSAVKDGERVEIGYALHSSADDATEELMWGMVESIELK